MITGTIAVGNGEKCPFCDTILSSEPSIPGDPIQEHLFEKHPKELEERLFPNKQGTNMDKILTHKVVVMLTEAIKEIEKGQPWKAKARLQGMRDGLKLNLKQGEQQDAQKEKKHRETLAAFNKLDRDLIKRQLLEYGVDVDKDNGSNKG